MYSMNDITKDTLILRPWLRTCGYWCKPLWTRSQRRGPRRWWTSPPWINRIRRVPDSHRWLQSRGSPLVAWCRREKFPTWTETMEIGRPRVSNDHRPGWPVRLESMVDFRISYGRVSSKTQQNLILKMEWQQIMMTYLLCWVDYQNSNWLT